MQPKQPKKGQPLPNTPSAAFVTLTFTTLKESLRTFGLTDVQLHENIQRDAYEFAAKPTPSYTVVQNRSPAQMKTRGCWDRNLANQNRIDVTPVGDHDAPTRQAAAANSNPPLAFAARGAQPLKGILKPKASATRRQRIAALRKAQGKSVAINLGFDVPSSSDESSGSGTTTVDEDTDNDGDMAERPKLKLKLSSAINPSPVNASSQTPNPQSAIRTPSLKLSFSKGRVDGSAKPKIENTNGDAPGSSAKKRKREQKAVGGEGTNKAPRPPQIRKLTFKTNRPVQNPVAPIIKLKSKGKIPKRPLGVGYDSELEEREVDPVILEGFVLRMQPGPDCDYLRKAVTEGTMGQDVRMRVLDTQGRRGILMIKSNQYATTLVDLPCIIEGMKSWDKKGFIKSIDISQMMLVLGPCKTDEEARNYPLPPDVDSHSYQFAHGLTAPMKWVRKRRFARTKRARVDDIEAIERRVNALLEADRQARNSTYELLDHDPQLEGPQYSPDEDTDAEGEDDDEDIEADNYFGIQNGHGETVETPVYAETPEEDIGQEDVDEFERMFIDDDDAPIVGDASQLTSTLHPPEGGDSSFAVTSTSASPSATAAQTPASGLDATSDEDEDDEDEERDDEEKDDDENMQQIRDRIQDVEDKIREQTDVLMRTQNHILRRKIAKKIEDLQDDVKMMKKSAGMAVEEDDDE